VAVGWPGMGFSAGTSEGIVAVVGVDEVDGVVLGVCPVVGVDGAVLGACAGGGVVL